jgi:hypothetical protein
MRQHKVPAHCGGEETMRKAALLVFIAASAPQVASAHVVRHNSIPETYRGTWAADPAGCNDAKAIIVLSAKAYAGPAGTCVVDYVSETAEPRGSTFSARMQCSNPPGQAQKKTMANLIMRPDGADRISLGPGFDSLKTYQRCSQGAPAGKQ